MDTLTAPLILATASSHKARVKRRSVNWESFIQKLKGVKVGPKEIDVFVPADMPDGRRRQSAVSNITALTYDIDNKGVDKPIYPKTLNEIIMRQGLSSIIYTTHSHRADYPRCRLIIQLNEPLSVIPYKRIAYKIAEKLGIERYMDKSAVEPAHCYFMPACDSQFVDHYQFLVSYGEPLRVDEFLAGEQGRPLELNTCPVESPLVIEQAQDGRKETPEAVAEVKAMLDAIPPDLDYERWRNVCWAVCSLGWSSGHELLLEWSMRSDEHWGDELKAQKAEAELKKLVGEYDDSWGISFDRAVHYARGNGYEEPSPFDVVEGFVYQASFSNSSLPEEVTDTDIITIEESGHPSPLELLRSFSITGMSQQLRQQMLKDAYVMQGIAILGQWTCLYAAPNTGKTLLTYWMLKEQIRAAHIEGSGVYYVNADDSYRGMVEKIEIAEGFGMQMLVPNQRGFTVSLIIELMGGLAKSGEASGLVIVLDTLKKFTDLMDKRIASKFGVLAREFVSAGGTLITLAHTNKHPDAEGKGIYSGTSDIVDDSDCCYIIDKVEEAAVFTGSQITVEFTNKKSRGDVMSKLGFTYTKMQGQNYAELLDSVKRIDEKAIQKSKRQMQVAEGLREDIEIIDAVLAQIRSSVTAKVALIKGVVGVTGDSHRQVKKVLELRTGNDYFAGHRWTVTKGPNNANIYGVLPLPTVKP